MHKKLLVKNLQVMLLLPFIVLCLAVFFEYSGVDLWWVSHFYDFETQMWVYKNHWLFNDIIHSGGRWLDRLIMLIWLIGFIVMNFKENMKKHRKIFIYFLCATAVGPIIVGIGKQTTHIYTPWDLKIFNGSQPYVRLLDTVPEGAPVGHAFPAGHASGGYCFLSLYFFLRHLKFSYRFHGLALGLGLGLVFGVGQQIRGAHFPSHDLFTLVICWYSAMLIFFLFYPQKLFDDNKNFTGCKRNNPLKKGS